MLLRTVSGSTRLQSNENYWILIRTKTSTNTRIFQTTCTREGEVTWCWNLCIILNLLEENTKRQATTVPLRALYDSVARFYWSLSHFARIMPSGLIYSHTKNITDSTKPMDSASTRAWVRILAQGSHSSKGTLLLGGLILKQIFFSRLVGLNNKISSKYSTVKKKKVLEWRFRHEPERWNNDNHKFVSQIVRENSQGTYK